MKKNPLVRQLNLSRSTIRRLTSPTLQGIRGAEGQQAPSENGQCTDSCPTICHVTSCKKHPGGGAGLAPQCPNA